MNKPSKEDLLRFCYQGYFNARDAAEEYNEEQDEEGSRHYIEVAVMLLTIAAIVDESDGEPHKTIKIPYIKKEE